MSNLLPQFLDTLKIWSDIGNHRIQNEDTHIIECLNIKSENDLLFFGVFDGHGGDECSKYLRDNFPNHLSSKIKQLSDIEQMKTSIVETCETINENFLKTSNANSGSCAIMGFIFNHKKDNQYKLITANIGDSRAVLGKNEPNNLKAIPLSRDHKPYDPEEKKYIESHGGNVLGGRIRGLAVSRAFGDKDIINYGLRVTPEFDLKTLDRNDLFIFACDGLWDVCGNREAVEFIYENDKVNISEKIVEYALNKGSTDNVTVIIGYLEELFGNSKK